MGSVGVTDKSWLMSMVGVKTSSSEQHIDIKRFTVERWHICKDCFTVDSGLTIYGRNVYGRNVCGRKVSFKSLDRDDTIWCFNIYRLIAQMAHNSVSQMSHHRVSQMS